MWVLCQESRSWGELWATKPCCIWPYSSDLFVAGELFVGYLFWKITMRIHVDLEVREYVCAVDDRFWMCLAWKNSWTAEIKCHDLKVFFSGFSSSWFLMWPDKSPQFTIYISPFEFRASRDVHFNSLLSLYGNLGQGVRCHSKWTLCTACHQPRENQLSSWMRSEVKLRYAVVLKHDASMLDAKDGFEYAGSPVRQVERQWHTKCKMLSIEVVMSGTEKSRLEAILILRCFSTKQEGILFMARVNCLHKKHWERVSEWFLLIIN